MASSSSVFVGMSAAVAFREYAEFTSSGKGSLKPVYAGFVGGLFLLIINAANEEAATMLLLILVVTSVVLNGASLITTVSKVVS